MNMILLSIRRRKKEIRYVSIVTFAAVFFMTGILLFQDILNQFIMERNRQLYGDWIVSSPEQQLSHPYLIREGYCDATVAVINSKGENTAHYIGAFDGNLADFGNISLYEGRLPENSGEVAMDLYSLSSLGYNYDLGQEITLSWLEIPEEGGEAVLHTNIYELVGTLKSYTSTWKTSPKTNLPAILLAEDELAMSYPAPSRTWFYQLDPSLTDLNTYEFYLAIQAEYEDAAYNSYVYNGQLWTNSNIFLSVTYVIIVIAGAAVGYLLASYTAKRRSIYYRYRCMGASKGQVRKMICIECLYATVPAAVLGILIAYLLGLAGCGIAANIYQLPYFFRFDAVMLVRQITAIAIILLIAILWTILHTRSSSLAAGNYSVSRKGLKKLHRIAPKAKHPERQFEKRYRRLHPFSYVMSILFSVLSCGFLILCAGKIDSIALTTWKSRQQYPDFTVSLHVWTEMKYQLENGTSGTRGSDTYDLTSGLDEKERAELRQIQGMDSVLAATYDEIHYLEWPEKENSQFLQYLRDKQYAHTELDYRTVFNFYESGGPVKEYLALTHLQTETDWAEWENGMSVIIILPARLYDSFANPENAWTEIYDDSIHPGETVTIRKINAEDSVQVKVADVLFSTETEFPINRTYSTTVRAAYITVLASTQMADRLSEASGETTKINYLKGRFNQFASFEATDKQLARFATSHGYDYSAYMAEMRRNYLQTVLQTIAVYGSLFCVMFIILIVLQKNFVDSRNRYRSAQYRLMKRIGMDDTAYLSMSLRAAVREYLWLLAGIPAAYLIEAYTQFEYYKYLKSNGSRVFCRLLDTFTDNPYWASLDHIVFRLPHVWSIAIVLVLFLILTANSYLRAKKYMKSER